MILTSLKFSQIGIQFIMLPNIENLEMRYIKPIRLKVIMMMFFFTGIVGIVIGLTIASSFSSYASLLITFMGVINLSLGGFFGWVFFTQQQTEEDPRKRKRKKK